NGDTFDLLPSGGASCRGETPTLGCSELEASGNLERVLKAHDAELRALARFVRQGTNRIALVAGDHDAALLFRGIGQRVVRAIGGPAGRVTVEAKGYWSSTDGQIVAEHGHQIGGSAHRFERWPAPFQLAGDGQRLSRSKGEALVQPLLARLEPRFPIVDNFAALGNGLKYALA